MIPELQKHFNPIVVTDDGIVIVFSDLQPENANIPMSTTDDGIETDDNEVHSLKIQLLRQVIEGGIVIDFNDLQ